jgi:hypothetical protein|tara:strand:+ start:55 stop:618 length:564 start_codon:yes stop_codon:yes gene_type:complete
MKIILVTIIISMGLFSCMKNDNFPKKETVLVEEFKSYSNFFPLEILNLKKFGINKKIPIIYVFFDHQEEGFTNNDDIDHFSFTLEINGKVKPTFKKSSLKISDSYQKYLDKSNIKFNKYRNESNHKPLSFPETPEWLQDDETPRNSKNISMKFICQIDSDEFTEDDSRMFVFFDNEKSEIRIIYQRT